MVNMLVSKVISRSSKNLNKKSGVWIGMDALCTDRRIWNYCWEIREKVEVQCTRIVAWLEHRDHVRDIDYTRRAVRHVQFRIMSTYNGRDLTPSVMLVQWSIFPTMAIAGFKQEGGWVTAHGTKRKEANYKVHTLPDTPLELDISDTDYTRQP